MIIVIPSYNEPDLAQTLRSLKDCKKNDRNVEVIVVFNCAEDEHEINKEHLRTIENLGKELSLGSDLKIRLINAPFIRKKTAGVGAARKVGMDEAVRRFKEIGYDGLIVCLDADCTVSHNYLEELANVAVCPQDYNSVCLHFEHLPHQQTDSKLKAGIIYYELFLRYYKEALKWAGMPFYFHTIGSSMAVKTSIYCKSGGMNKRKAGEDFYFLHKVFPYGKVIELNSVSVFPSSRISHRVPFGTGRAQQNFSEKESGDYLTYDFKIFEELKQFLDLDLYREIDSMILSDPINKFLSINNFSEKIREIRENIASEEQFKKRFFSWFDGFMVLKYVHFARDNYYPNIGITDAVSVLFNEIKINSGKKKASEFLHLLRKIQKQEQINFL